MNESEGGESVAAQRCAARRAASACINSPGRGLLLLGAGQTVLPARACCGGAEAKPRRHQQVHLSEQIAVRWVERGDKRWLSDEKTLSLQGLQICTHALRISREW